MKHLIVKILINAAALMLTANLIDGIYVDGWGAVIIAAIILGIVNAWSGAAGQSGRCWCCSRCR